MISLTQLMSLDRLQLMDRAAGGCSARGRTEPAASALLDCMHKLQTSYPRGKPCHLVKNAAPVGCICRKSSNLAHIRDVRSAPNLRSPTQRRNGGSAPPESRGSASVPACAVAGSHDIDRCNRLIQSWRHAIEVEKRPCRISSEPESH